MLYVILSSSLEKDGSNNKKYAMLNWTKVVFRNNFYNQRRNATKTWGLNWFQTFECFFQFFILQNTFSKTFFLG